MSSYTIDGCFNVRWTTLDICGDLEYRCDRWGDISLMDIKELFVWSERRQKMVKPSARFIHKFYGENVKWIEDQVRSHSAGMAEYYREQRRESIEAKEAKHGLPHTDRDRESGMPSRECREATSNESAMAKLHVNLSPVL